MGDRYVKLPYGSRVKLKQAKRLRARARAAEKGAWTGKFTDDQRDVLYRAGALIREEADRARRDALCR